MHVAAATTTTTNPQNRKHSSWPTATNNAPLLHCFPQVGAQSQKLDNRVQHDPTDTHDEGGIHCVRRKRLRESQGGGEREQRHQELPEVLERLE